MIKKTLAVALLVASFGAAASCPPYAPYNCVPTYNGKMACGCGR